MQHSFIKPEEFEEEICRICLVVHNSTMSLFEPYKEYSIGRHLSALAEVSISPGDGLPERICEGCFKDLQAAILFKERCQASDQQLRGNSSATTDIKKEEPQEYEQETHLDDKSESEDHFNNSQPETPDIKDEVHINHTTEKHFECHDCGEIFKSKCKLRVHWKKEHKPKSYNCEICRSLFKSVLAYKRHMKIKPKSCSIMAIENVRIENEGRRRIFYCTICDYKTNHVNCVMTHSVTHNKKKPFSCNLCTQSYTQLGALHRHKETAHYQYRMEITCDVCGKHIKGREKVYRHLQQHSTQRYQCDLCKKLLKNKKYLVDHLRRHRGIKEFTCEECGLAFFTVVALYNHKRVVHKKIRNKRKEKVWLHCELCSYKSYFKKTIEKHRMGHSADNVPCETCGMFFKSEEKLHIHERFHLLARKYVCPICNLGFRQSRHLSGHQKTHRTGSGDLAKLFKYNSSQALNIESTE